MKNNVAINLNNPSEVRRRGLSALNEALGPAGAIIFLQQFESGSGDYTNEKYEEPDIPIGELVRELRWWRYAIGFPAGNKMATEKLCIASTGFFRVGIAIN
jgi:hypothetical protein